MVYEAKLCDIYRQKAAELADNGNRRAQNFRLAQYEAKKEFMLLDDSHDAMWGDARMVANGIDLKWLQEVETVARRDVVSQDLVRGDLLGWMCAEGVPVMNAQQQWNSVKEFQLLQEYAMWEGLAGNRRPRTPEWLALAACAHKAGSRLGLGTAAEFFRPALNGFMAYIDWLLYDHWQHRQHDDEYMAGWEFLRGHASTNFRIHMARAELFRLLLLRVYGYEKLPSQFSVSFPTGWSYARREGCITLGAFFDDPKTHQLYVFSHTDILQPRYGKLRSKTGGYMMVKEVLSLVGLSLKLVKKKYVFDTEQVRDMLILVAYTSGSFDHARLRGTAGILHSAHSGAVAVYEREAALMAAAAEELASGAAGAASRGVAGSGEATAAPASKKPRTR